MRVLEMIEEFEFLRDNEYLLELSKDLEDGVENESVYDRVDSLQLNDEEYDWIEELILDYIKVNYNIKGNRI